MSTREFDKIYEIMVVLVLDMKDEGYVPLMSYLCNLIDDDIDITQ